MLEQIILGAIQGITEWVPVSSEGCIILAKTKLFHSAAPINQLINYALLLHLGTLLAALVYFRNEIAGVFAAICNYKESAEGSRKLLLFLALTTVISGGLGFMVVKLFAGVIYTFPKAGAALTIFIGCLLWVTGFLQWRAKDTGTRTVNDLRVHDGILLGILQGLATLPGLSRSGTTIAALLLTKFDKQQALKLSFLMSMPLILFGNIILNIKHFTSVNVSLVGILTAFIVGLASINVLMKFAQKVNFSIFLFFFGSLMILSVFL